MYQKLIIIGNLGRDPEMQYTQAGLEVTKCSVACKAGKDKTIWFRVSVFGKQAESCNQYLHKGSKVLVEGRLRPDESGNPRVYQRKDGSWGSSYEVTADNIQFVGNKKSEQLTDEDVPYKSGWYRVGAIDVFDEGYTDEAYFGTMLGG